MSAGTGKEEPENSTPPAPPEEPPAFKNAPESEPGSGLVGSDDDLF